MSLARDVGVNIPLALTMPFGKVVTDSSGATVVGIFNLPAVCIVVFVSALLISGIRQSANTNTVLVVIKAMVLVVFVVAGASYVRRENLTPFIPPNTGQFGHFGLSGILRGAGVMFFAYIGFDAVTTAAQESKDPQRDMPVGILGSLAICTVLYIAVAIVLTGIVHYTKLNVADPLAVGIDATGLQWLSPVIKVSAIFGLFSTMLVQLLGQTRIFFSMARDGLLPRVFGRVHARYRTPHVSTLVTGTVCAFVAGLTSIEVLGQLVSIGTLLAFVLVCIGVVILRRTAPQNRRPFRTPRRAVGAGAGRDHLPRADGRTAGPDLGTARDLARDRTRDLLPVRAQTRTGGETRATAAGAHAKSRSQRRAAQGCCRAARRVIVAARELFRIHNLAAVAAAIGPD